MPYLAKGSYLLTVMEMASKTKDLPGGVDGRSMAGGREGCAHFSLRLRTSKAPLTKQLSSLSATTGGIPPVPLPTTLNIVTFLKYGGTMHSFGTYAFPRSGACKHTVTFDLARDSRFRLDARAVAGGSVVAVVTRMGDEVHIHRPTFQSIYLSIDLSFPPSSRQNTSVNECVQHP